MVIKDLVDNDLSAEAQFLENTGQYIKRALEIGNAIYFYAIEKEKRDIDKLSWIRDIKHEEYDMISIAWIHENKVYCQPTVLGDKVIKLDLTDKDVKRVFDDKFKIGITWAKEGVADKIGREDSLFVKEAGYEFYNFVVAKDDEAIMDAMLYGGEDASIRISRDIVDEVDKECEKGKMRRDDMIIKEFMCSNLVCKDYQSKNIACYMKRGLERGNTIYFYAIDPVGYIKDIDNLSWIRDIKHEEYDMISVQWPTGMKRYYQSKVLSDKVIKLDLTDRDVKKIFDDRFKIGTTWVNGGIGGDKVGENDPLFDEDGYEFHNFVVTKDDEVIMDATLHGAFEIAISKDIVDEVDKECAEEREKRERRRKKWRRIICPFGRQ